MHHDGKLVWANAIVYSYKKQLAARHSDDTALAGNCEGSWGWLADKQFDIYKQIGLSLSKHFNCHQKPVQATTKLIPGFLEKANSYAQGCIFCGSSIAYLFELSSQRQSLSLAYARLRDCYRGTNLLYTKNISTEKIKYGIVSTDTSPPTE